MDTERQFDGLTDRWLWTFFWMPNERPAYRVKGQGEMRDDNDFLMTALKGNPFASRVKCFHGGKELCRERRRAADKHNWPGHYVQQLNSLTPQDLVRLPCSLPNHYMMQCSKKGRRTALWDVSPALHFNSKVGFNSDWNDLMQQSFILKSEKATAHGGDLLCVTFCVL